MFGCTEVPNFKQADIYIFSVIISSITAVLREALPSQRSKSSTFYSSYFMVSLFSHFAVSSIWNLFCSLARGEDVAFSCVPAPDHPVRVPSTAHPSLAQGDLGKCTAPGIPLSPPKTHACPIPSTYTHCAQKPTGHSYHPQAAPKAATDNRHKQLEWEGSLGAV